jgi:hypothetical protein
VRRGITYFLVLAAALFNAPARGATYASDNLRTGWYPDQPTLSPTQISAGKFGPLFSPVKVIGPVHAQPLIASGIVVVATEENWVYGLSQVDGTERWSQGPGLLGRPWNPLGICRQQPATDVNCAPQTVAGLTRYLLGPHIGITSTPVIDEVSGLIYLVAKRYVRDDGDIASPTAFYLHALSITTGVEQSGFPIELSGNAEDGSPFNPNHHLQRAALLLLDGVVYIAFGGVVDFPDFQGWVFGVSTVHKKIVSVWCSVHSYDPAKGFRGGSVWQSGSGLMSDKHGRIFLATGNGSSLRIPDRRTPGNVPPNNLGNSLVALSVQPDLTLRTTQFFTPATAATLDAKDCDLGSGGPVGLPPRYFGINRQLIIQAGKEGTINLHDADALGGFGNGDKSRGRGDQVLASLKGLGSYYSHAAIWPGDGGRIYLVSEAEGDASTCYRGSAKGILASYRVLKTAVGWTTVLDQQAADVFHYGSSSPIVTSDRTISGSALVWITRRTENGTDELRAYEASDLGPVFSAPIGHASKFTLPGIGGGRVFVATSDGLVFGFGPQSHH